MKWHNKPPVNGRELVAEDVKFTYDRFLTEKGNGNRYLLDAVDRIEVVDRYTVKFLLKEPFVWLINVLAYPLSTWIVAPEVVQQYGDLKKAETAIGTGPFILERYEPNVKSVFKRNPDYYRKGQPYVEGWNGWSSRMNRPVWRCIAPGRSTVARALVGPCDNRIWTRSSRLIPSSCTRISNPSRDT